MDRTLLRRPLAGIAIASALAMGVSACGGGGSEPASAGAHNIAAVMDSTGVGKALGQAQMNGLRAAVDGINDRGGVDGHDIKLVLRDDNSTPATAVQVYNQLTKEDVSAVVGFVASAASAAVAEVAERGGLAVLTTSAPTSVVASGEIPVYSTIASLNAQGRAGLNYIKAASDAGDLPSNPKIASFYYASPAGQGWNDAMKTYAESLGLGIAQSVSGDIAAASYSAQAAQIASSKPDAVLLFAQGQDVLTLGNALATAGLAEDTMFANYSFGGPPATLKGMYDLGFANYAAVGNWRLPADAKQYTEDVEKAGFDPEGAFVQDGYAYGLILASILEDCGFPCDKADFIKAADQLDLDTDFAYGPIRITSSNHDALTMVRFARFNGTTVEYAGEAVNVD